MEKKCLKLSGKLWNELIRIDGLEDFDKQDLMHHIHAIQNILYARLYLKENGLVSITESVIAIDKVTGEEVEIPISHDLNQCPPPANND